MGFFDKIKRVFMGGGDEREQNFVQDRRQQRQQQMRREYNDIEHLRNAIRLVLQKEYLAYEIREGVEVSSLDASQQFGGPIDFALFNNGKFIGAVMLLEGSSKRSKRIQGVELVCRKLGAGYANFYVGFNNEYFPFSSDYASRYLRRQIS